VQWSLCGHKIAESLAIAPIAERVATDSQDGYEFGTWLIGIEQDHLRVIGQQDSLGLAARRACKSSLTKRFHQRSKDQ
jgi:hypothetical protein